jgi:replicative DNA helicase
MQISPYSLERRIYQAETRLLGGLLRSPRRLPRYAARLKPLHFYDYRHQLIWAAMLNLHQRGAPVRVETVLAELVREARDDDAGGLRYLNWLTEQTPKTAHLNHSGQPDRQRQRAKRRAQFEA